MKQKTPSSKINIVHIDDDRIFHKCVKQAISNDPKLEVTKTFESGNAFLKNLKENLEDIHLIILDMKLGDMDGLEIVRKLQAVKCNIPIISLTILAMAEYNNALKEEGVAACIQKAQLPALLPTIKLVMKYPIVKLKNLNFHKLNDDDIILLKCICDYYTNEQIAEEIGRSIDTVKKRKQSLAHKLGLENENSRFIVWAIQNGYHVMEQISVTSLFLNKFNQSTK